MAEIVTVQRISRQALARSSTLPYHPAAASNALLEGMGSVLSGPWSVFLGSRLRRAQIIDYLALAAHDQPITTASSHAY
jgi:hypothetical protein